MSSCHAVIWPLEQTGSGLPEVLQHLRGTLVWRQQVQQAGALELAHGLQQELACPVQGSTEALSMATATW